MGFPVLSIQEFENKIKERPKPWVVMLFANAYSDSAAVKIILDNFHQMDKISQAAADFYLPGYNYQYAGIDVPFSNKLLSHTYEDYHVKKENINITPQRRNHGSYIEKGPYVGKIRNGSNKIIFNEAEYADFVCEIISQKQDFEYNGCCQMLIIPVNEKLSKPEYEKSLVYDLDEISLTNVYPLSRYLFTIFNILRRSTYTNREEIKRQFDNLYIEAVEAWNTDKYEIILSALINDMESCLGWRLDTPYYFISYSSKDSHEAFKLCTMLNALGIKTWIAPKGIPMGRDYAMAVPTALKRSNNFLLLLSNTSANSRWVQRELDMAVKNEDKIKVKILLTKNFNIENIRDHDQMDFYLNKIQIKFSYDEIISDKSKLSKFIEE